MPLPTKVKTWQYNVNQTFVTSGTELTDYQHLLRKIKDSLIGFGTNPWTVYYSCDSVTAGTAGDLVDRWTTDAKLVWTNGVAARSWMVLKQAATGFQLLLHCRNATTATARGLGAYFSIGAGFTGGTTTAAPTATDQITVCGENETATGTGGRWVGPGATGAFSCVLHALQSTDGKCTRVFVCFNNLCASFLIIDVPYNPSTGWTTPNVVSFKGINNATTTTYARLAKASTTTLICQANINTVACNVGFTGEMTATNGSQEMTAETQNCANDIDGTYPIFPIGICSDTAGKTGRHGVLFDLWWASTVANIGDTFPGDNTRQFATFGNIITPWNGTVPIVGI